MNRKRKLSPNDDCLHGTGLLSLDDMVLLQIMKYLRITDLVNLMETCTRMERLVNEHFQKHHSIVYWKNYRLTRGSSIRPSESKRIFKHLGKHVKTIILFMWADFEFYEILVILAQGCHSLDCLILDSIQMSQPLVFCDPLIKQLFSRLKRFAISGCYWQGWCPLDKFFGNNETLEDLSVVNCIGFNAHDGHGLKLAGFEALKKLRLIQCPNGVTETELYDCFANNLILTLVLRNIGDVDIFQDNIIECICDSVEDLTIDFFHDANVNDLLLLHNLRVLRLHCNVYNDISRLLSQLGTVIPLEELEIVKVSISSETIDALKQFTNLKRLSLDYVVNSVQRQFFRALPNILPQIEHFGYGHSTIRDEDVLYMFKLMPQLKGLNFFRCNSLATKTYLEMIDILEKDLHRPILVFVPPRWESIKSFLEIVNKKKNMQLDTKDTVINVGG